MEVFEQTVGNSGGSEKKTVGESNRLLIIVMSGIQMTYARETTLLLSYQD